MISSLITALQTNIDTFNSAASRIARPRNDELVDDVTELIVAEHSVEANLSALRQLNQLERHMIDLLA